MEEFKLELSKFKITEKTVAYEILATRPTSEDVFKELDLKCYDCIVAFEHRIEDISKMYSFSTAILIRKLSACPLNAEKVKQYLKEEEHGY